MTTPLKYYAYWYDLDIEEKGWYYSALEHLRGKHDISKTLEVEYDVTKIIKPPKEKKALFIPEGLTNLVTSTETFGTLARNEIRRRKKSPELLVEHFKLQLCGMTTDPYFRGSIFIPYFDINGELIYYQCRDVSGQRKAKYVYPHIRLTSNSKSDFLFIIQSLLGTDKAFLVESFFNVAELQTDLTLRNTIGAVGIGGSKLSPSQAALLASFKQLKKLYICFDGDAMENAYKAAKLLYMIAPHLTIYVIDSREFGTKPNLDKISYYDVDEVGFRRVLQQVKKTKRYSPLEIRKDIPILGSNSNTISYEW